MTTEPAPSPTPAPAAPAAPAVSEVRRHWMRLAVIWAALSVVVDVLWIKLVGPHVPPGRMSDTANGAAFDFNVLVVMAAPVMIAVWVYMAYAIVTWRASKVALDPVPARGSRGHGAIESWWILLTTVIVLFLAGFGTFELIQPEGAGGGQGPTPLWTPASKDVLQVQVIGQQWKWTYRYPSFGGMETNALYLPVNTPVAFHVTSLDVIHSFWAYQLGVKADADPATDNVAFTTPTQQGQFQVRCSELCGLWHGAMYNTGHVVSKYQFESWALKTEAMLAQNTKLLPPFAYSYVPDANGADGSYYPNTADPYSPVETYGAQAPAGGG